MTCTRTSCLVCGFPEAWCTCPRDAKALPSLLPWEAMRDDNTDAVYVLDAAGWSVAMVLDGNACENPPEPPRTDADVWANAVLLAAAPELLDVLRRIIPHFKRDTVGLAECHTDPTTGAVGDEEDPNIGKEVDERFRLLEAAVKVIERLKHPEGV